MKSPQRPPPYALLLTDDRMKKFDAIAAAGRQLAQTGEYLHWDELRRHKPPEGLTVEDWWLGVKVARNGALRELPLKSKDGKPFRFAVPEQVQAELHRIDVGAGGALGVPEPIMNPQTKDRYLIRSLMEEAITSSQLEGAVTTREVAKEMIRSGRLPRDTSEQMILNNFVTMQHITQVRDQSLTAEMVFSIHQLVTEKTLDDATAAGRFRQSNEHRVVADEYGEIFHDPPPAEELPARLKAMCDFANAKTPEMFVHPVVRAIILHFWVAYDHPFVDGNGRTARALFYWAMLRQKYWLFEFISISNILRKAPAQYYRSFLHTESDENDLTYFIIAQAKVICDAIQALHGYIDHKTKELHELEQHMRTLDLFNHRQAEIIKHAIKHPHQQYTIASHGKSHQVVYQTARTDLLDLAKRSVLEQKRRGKQLVFTVPKDLESRLRKLEKKAGLA